MSALTMNEKSAPVERTGADHLEELELNSKKTNVVSEVHYGIHTKIILN